MAVSEHLTVPVVRRSDVVVVTGGPAGVSAAVATARAGATVTLLADPGRAAGSSAP